jgi:hypothetical protein
VHIFQPARVKLELLTCDPNPVTVGNPSTGTVRLNRPTSDPFGAKIALSSYAPEIVTVPDNVSIRAGAISNTFAINTINHYSTSAGATGKTTINASYGLGGIN